jgi:hypothetical protein
MSLREDETQASNEASKKLNQDAFTEHLVAMEKERIANEAAASNSVGSAWNALGVKRTRGKLIKVLQRFPLQSQ